MEIKSDTNFSIHDSTLIDMHSVLNVLNVIIYELLQLDQILGNSPELSALYDVTVDAAHALNDAQQALLQVANVDQLIDQVEVALDQVAMRVGKLSDPSFISHRDNIRSIFAILKVRAREIVARHNNPDAWVVHDINELKANFFNVFRAIERNSFGQYRIVHNLAQHDDGDYLVLMEISSCEGPSIRMPAVFQDVMRDLLANARKYTPPGGTIQSGLDHSGKELRFVVSDNGIGIPVDEIPMVVEFGYRGSNARDRTTRGGGFGLTKAYHVTRRFGGRMWIFSQGLQGKGTRVEIRIPCPA